jgi:pentatricopeptide repeat protein
MTASEALVLIRGYASAGRITLTIHARERMIERGITFHDVRSGLATAPSCGWQPERASWRVDTFDRTGDTLVVIVVLAGEDVVVTVF